MISETEPNRPVTIEGSDVPVIFANGAMEHLGQIMRGLGAKRVLLVTDRGIRAAGHVGRAVRALYRAGVVVRVFDEAVENPTTKTVLEAWRVGEPFRPDWIVGLGGGSSMDTAKGVNFLLTNRGRMQDYWGTDKAPLPMLPLVAIPTTAGTGSEAQSYALITDPETHVKMACGDKKALPKLAILDPELTATVPPPVARATAIDAVAHAIETAGCNRRNEISRRFSKEAWERLNGAFKSAMEPASAGSAPRTDGGNGARSEAHTGDAEARREMLIGAHLAGCAIEQSMLGAAHATANPLTAKFDVTHGLAVGVMLPWVIRFNCANGENPYADLLENGEELARWVERMLDAAGLPRSLPELGVPAEAIDELAAMAAKQWTAGFNPRKVGEVELREIYLSAMR